MELHNIISTPLASDPSGSTPANILVVGYGISGKSVTAFLELKGHNVCVYDDDKTLNIPNRVSDDIDWSQIDLVIKSPSVHIMPHNRHPIIDLAMLNGKLIYSTFDVFSVYNPDAKIIGITGTNGKSTTAALVYHILKTSGVPVVLGGNIGIPYFELSLSKNLPSNNLDVENNKKLEPDQYYVFEISSYELTSSKLLRFDTACILNIEPDHLDFHGSFENYINAKHKILAHAKHKIISCDDPYTIEQYKNHTQGQADVSTVSLSPNIFAQYYIENHLMIANGTVALDISNLSNLLGNHNAQNLMFAYAICDNLGIPQERIVHGIKTFEPLPHRMNMVRKIGDVLFVNDSKATNPPATAPALSTFTGYKIFWLVGGRSKNVDPIPYIGKYLGSVEKIYLFGEAMNEFYNIFHNIKPVELCQTLSVAVHRAYSDAKNEIGATVILLSPMCSSFDQFTSFEHRGKVFVNLVNGL